MDTSLRENLLQAIDTSCSCGDVIQAKVGMGVAGVFSCCWHGMGGAIQAKVGMGVAGVLAAAGMGWVELLASMHDWDILTGVSAAVISATLC